MYVYCIKIWWSLQTHGSHFMKYYECMMYKFLNLYFICLFIILYYSPFWFSPLRMIMFLCVIYLTVIIRGEMIHLSSPEDLVLVNKVYLLFIIIIFIITLSFNYLFIISPSINSLISKLSMYLIIYLYIYPSIQYPSILVMQWYEILLIFQ